MAKDGTWVFHPEIGLPATPMVRAYEAILDVLLEDEAVGGGGCPAFYSPTGWAQMGYSDNTNGVLVVVDNAGEHAPYFNPDYRRCDLIQKMSAALKRAGFSAQPMPGPVWCVTICELAS